MAIKNVFSTAAIFLAVVLSGCVQTSTGVVTTPSPSTISNNTNTTNLTFSKVTTEREIALNTLITSFNPTSNQTGANNAQPQAASSPSTNTTAVSSGVSDSAMYSGSYYSYYPQNGNFEQYAVINYEEAKKDGFKGTYQTVLNQVIKPIISLLASDTRLVSSNGSTDNTGTNIATGIDSVVSNYSYNQWQFNYVSASKKEFYNILVSEKETLVLKQTWGIINLNTDDIKTDSNAAIEIIKNAVKNHDFVSPENTTVKYGTGIQVLYDLPDKTNWSFYLANDKGVLVWNINFNLPYSNSSRVTIDVGSGTVSSSTTTPTTGSTGTAIYYSGGYAKINAKTGIIISLTRPYSYNNVYAVPPIAVDAKSVTK